MLAVLLPFHVALIRAALLNDVRAFASDQVRVTDAALLCYSILGEAETDDSGGVSKHRLRHQLRQHANENMMIPLAAIPGLLASTCLLDVPVATFQEIVDRARSVSSAAAASSQLVLADVSPPGGDQAAVVPAHRYESLSRDDLIAQLGLRDASLKSMQHELKKSCRREKYWMKRSGTIGRSLEAASSQPDDLNARVRLGPGKRNVSCIGGYTLALKRNLGGSALPQLRSPSSVGTTTKEA